jgi:glycosyltransferase involved in cell wall biosynthesis
MQRTTQQPTRIGMVITNLSGSGAERIALNLAEMFVERGHPVDLFLLENTVNFSVDTSINLHFLTRNRTLYKWFGRIGDRLLANKLQRLVNKLSDATSTPFGLFLSHLPAADKVVALCHLPNTWHCIHSSYTGEIAQFKQQRRWMRAFRKRRLYKTLYSGKNLVAVSSGVRNDLINNLEIKPRNIQTIFNPFNFENIRNLASVKPKQLADVDFILHASAFRPVKRHDILLEAFAKLKHTIKLVLLANPCRELNNMISKLGLQDKVLILGHQENPYPFMKRAKLTILTSKREGLPTVIIESLICGTPVVSTDCPSGPREILTGELSEWLVSVNNPTKLAEKIDMALETDINIPNSAIERFTSKKVYMEYLKLITRAHDN